MEGLKSSVFYVVIDYLIKINLENSNEVEILL